MPHPPVDDVYSPLRRSAEKGNSGLDICMNYSEQQPPFSFDLRQVYCSN